MMQIDISLVDYSNKQQLEDIVTLLDHYSNDLMGGGKPLPESIKIQLPKQLSKIAHSFCVICYIDNNPAGLATCFEGFSTFKAKPLINIHDIVVHTAYRGLGISQKILEKVEQIAQEKGCCKITLEVLEGNKTAQKAYEKFGFRGYELDPQMGKALFWEKNV
jgi:ribosomal protein S18 acetylase RimI-like enzyme